MRTLEPEQFEDEDDIPLALLQNQEDVAIVTSTLNLLQSSFPEGNFTVQDLETLNNADKCLIAEGTTTDSEDNTAIDLTDSEEDSNATLRQKVKHSDAINAFQTCINWAEENEIEHSKVFILRSLQEQAIDFSITI